MRKMNGSMASSRADAEEASDRDEVVIGAVAEDAVGADSSSSPNSSGDGDGPCPAFLKFLGCELVVDQVMQYLNFGEMKDFSSLSKDTLIAVRRSREFSKRSRFIISNYLFSSGVDLENLCPYLWKTISYDVSLPMSVVILVADKLKDVQSLFLYHGPREESYEKFYNLSPTLLAQCCLRILEILRNAKNLRELGFRVNFLKFLLYEAFSTREMQQSMCNIESLIILNPHGEYAMAVGDELPDFLQFQLNLSQLSNCLGLKLKKFKMESIDEDNLDSIAKLVERSKGTLEELELGRDAWRLPELALVQCEKLRRLDADVDEKDFGVFADFVQLQPRMEELRLRYTTSVPAKCWKLLEGRLTKVRVFRFDCGAFKERWHPTLVDWTFLKSMTELEEFAVTLPRHGRGPQMIESLPEKVRKLRVSSHGAYQYFWAEYCHLDEFSAVTGDHLRRLKNLTHLSLFDCFAADIDAPLQIIIKNCENLRELRFGNFRYLTDFGISGVKADDDEGIERESGVPLSHLKELVDLEIKDCDLLSAACVLNVIRFKFLRWFSFDTSERDEIQDKEQFASQLFAQNPNLLSFRHNGSSWGRNGPLV